MPIIMTDKLIRSEIRMQPEARFVYGDNLARLGMGGQARQARGEPNSIGVATKRYPGFMPEDYFSDRDDEIAAVNADLQKVQRALNENRAVFWPSAGIGTGLAELEQRAPKIWAMIQQRLKIWRGLD